MEILGQHHCCSGVGTYECKLTVVDPDYNVFPIVSMATIGRAVGDLVFRHVKGIHDSVAASVPASASVSLAVSGIVAASA